MTITRKAAKTCSNDCVANCRAIRTRSTVTAEFRCRSDRILMASLLHTERATEER
ncbi:MULTISPECIES: hypothetical protein [Streptomyces]|uniref:Uncharacterized protein n=1 Tax=Streptomyces siderophoricus TaxID=2802281 RepID=A0ABS1MTH2_9ACTN|nr:hypothetical protein [Streptomyces sp. 9-7]MBL1091085.1 hypothetical protein [Streptomyces sp. 9-7]